MGNWNISIQGIGAHHNKDNDHDADKMAKKFVDELKKYHNVEAATFTYGGKEELVAVVLESES